MAGKKEAKAKPLEKMTAKELKDLAKEVPEITGIHGMNKIELISAVKKSKGIKEAPGKKTDVSVRQVKEKLRAVRAKQEKAVSSNDTKMAAIYRKRIIRLKKKTRRTV